MIFAQRLLTYVERALEERFSLHVFALQGIVIRQVGEAGCGVLMIFAQRLLIDVECGLV